MIDLTVKKVFLQNTNILVPLERKFYSDQLLINDLWPFMTSLGHTGSQSKFVKLQGKKRKIKVIDL